jgi:hypothetical protein
MAAVLAVVCVVQVRYRYEDEPGTIGICQCDRSQRQSGSAFLIGVIFPKEAATIATIRADGTGRGEQIFRYAPLSNGPRGLAGLDTAPLLVSGCVGSGALRSGASITADHDANSAAIACLPRVLRTKS